MWRRRLAALGLLFAGWPTTIAWACPACGGAGSEESRAAYIATTVVLSLLPLSMIFGCAYWLRRQTRSSA